MITLTFYSFAEKRPIIGQEIIFLRKRYSFDETYFEPCQAIVRAQWTQLKNGENSFSAVWYSPNTPPPEPFEQGDVHVTFRLDLVIGGYLPEDDWHWMPLEDMLEQKNEQN